jgi:hypothetical protein
MGAKSIITVDVRDQAWKDFQKSFSKYQSALANQPTVWSKINASFAAHKKQLGSLPATWGLIGKAANAAVNPFIKIAAATAVMNARIKAAPTFMGKLKVVAQSTVGVFDRVAKGAFSIAKGIGKATLGLLKWAGIASIFSGLLGGAGLFGLDRLAASAGNSRRDAQGFGLTPGDLKSAQINFAKFTDVNSALENVANTRSDLSKRWIFNALGVNPDQGSNVDVLGQSLKSAKHTFERTGMTQQGADAYGLTQLFSMDDLRRLHAMTDQEIDDAIKKQRTDREALAVSDDTLKGWQSLQIQLDKAGSQIENVLIKKLSGLSGPLSQLSQAVADAIGMITSDPALPGYIKDFGDKIREFAKYLTSDQFKSDLSEFVDGVKKATAALKDLFGWIYDKLTALGIIKPQPVASGAADGQLPRKPSDWDRKAPSMIDNLAWKVQQWSGTPGYFSEFEKKNGLPAGTLAKIQSVEFSRKKDLSLAVSPVGAKGPFQFMEGTAKQYGLDDPFNLHDSAEAAARKMRDLMKMFNGDIEKAYAAYNWGEGNLKKDIEQHGGDWKAFAPKETRDYVSKLTGAPTRTTTAQHQGSQTITINNNTGGNAAVTTNALAY